MASAEFVDPYLDPDTGLLRNKVGARTKLALDNAESDLSFARLMQLMDRPPKFFGGGVDKEGRIDVSERVDDYLAHGFGSPRPAR
ncbi:hypothetical protein [Tessaracoccus caeni]|uniref:hypothetical protein n=1 Tax=Tessaracoccus caeni TaxID=3031239 RepID=UPI0023D978F9|nr:hypothetical protein [Tessaracoccus caeni]MDF1489617.1 hypothetical protein [Tessaracoccus caeni]